MTGTGQKKRLAAMDNTSPTTWARDAVERLLTKCLRAAAAEMQNRSEELLMEMLRRGRL